jgi:hypothetical protein
MSWGTNKPQGGVSGLTATQLLFGGSDGLIDQSSNLTWNDSTKRLTISGASATLFINETSGSGAGIAIQDGGISQFTISLDGSLNTSLVTASGKSLTLSAVGAAAMAFNTNGAERARIDSAGKFYVGPGGGTEYFSVTPASSIINITPSGTGDGFRFNVTSAAAGLTAGVYLASSGLSSGERLQFLTDATATVGAQIGASIWNTTAGEARSLWHAANRAGNPELILVGDGGNIGVGGAAVSGRLFTG